MRLCKITSLIVLLALLSACVLLSRPQTQPPLHHSQTLRKASAETVKGDFERNKSYEFAGAKAEMWRDSEGFYIRFGATETYKIESVVGDDKLEEYVARQNGKQIHLPIAYDLRRHRWSHLTDTVLDANIADFISVKTDWATTCAGCHAAETARQIPTECAACHAKPLNPSKPDTIHYSAREYADLLRSVCFVKNKGGNVIHCQSCHTANMKEKPTPQACINCHQHFAEPEAVFEHTKHQPAWANCFSCHQPETSYGHLAFQRTHEISIPNPTLTVAKNTPNACNLCHVNKSVNWAIAASKRHWATRFHDAQISNNEKFNQPETMRALTDGSVFIRALAADALSKHADQVWIVTLYPTLLEAENLPFASYFLNHSLEQKHADK